MKSKLYSKFAESQIENDLDIKAGANNTMTYMAQRTYVAVGDYRHICDTTLNDTVVIGVSFPKK